MRRIGLRVDDERVPLGSERVEMGDIERAEEYADGLDGDDGMKGENGISQRKGKSRSGDDKPKEVVFSVGDDDEDGARE